MTLHICSISAMLLRAVMAGFMVYSIQQVRHAQGLGSLIFSTWQPPVAGASFS